MRARQLFRFHHAPNAWTTRGLVTDDDIHRARLAQPDYLHKDSPEEPDWPSSWETNLKSLLGVLCFPAWRMKPSQQADVPARNVSPVEALTSVDPAASGEVRVSYRYLPSDQLVVRSG